MRIEFDSIADLKAFLDFAGYAKKNDGTMTVNMRVSSDELENLQVIAEHQVKTITEMGIATADTASPSDTASPEQPEKVTRKRRTKAEIAADEAAKAAGEAPASAPVNETADVETVASPFDAEPAPVNETTQESTAEPTAPPSDIEHLKLCREFIASHGMAKYDQTFVAAGLEGKNIMSFTDADRAKHAAALAAAKA